MIRLKCKLLKLFTVTALFFRRISIYVQRYYRNTCHPENVPVKLLLILSVGLLQQHFAFAQLGDRSPVTLRLPSVIFLNEVLGKPFNPSANNEIAGSAFFNNTWKLCLIKLKDGRHFDEVPARLNIFSQTVHYLSANFGIEMEAPAGLITELQMNDTTADGKIETHLFSGGFKPIEKNDENTFYEVLETGKANLLLHRKVKVIETKSLGSPVADKEYQPFQEYYIIINDTLVKCRKSGSFFIELFTDKKDQVKQYIDTNKLKFKSEKDFRPLVAYYNSL